MSAEVASSVEVFIRERFHVAADDAYFSRQSNLWEEGYIDSTGVLELIAHLESTFDIRLDDEVLFDASFSSIDGIAGIVSASITRQRPCSPDSATTTSDTDPA